MVEGTEKEKEARLMQEVAKKVEEKEHSRIMRNFLILAGFILAIVVTFIVVGNSNSSFEYRGVDFQLVEEIAPYRTSVLINTQDSVTGAVVEGVPYYFYLRNSPKNLEWVKFKGDLELKTSLAIRSEEDFTCNGYGTIGVLNLANLYRTMGIEVLRDETAECDEQGRYMLLKIERGDKTEIERIGEACYVMKVNECEILPATERFMIETFVEYNRLLESE